MGRGRIDSSQSLKKNTSLLEVQILVVDDDSISLAIVSSMLKTCSLQVVSLDNKESAILKSLESVAIFHMVKPVNEQDLNNIWQYAVASKKGKAVVTDPEMNNNIEEGTASSNDQDVNSASSVNEDSNKKKKGRKRSRDDHDEDAPSAPKKAKVVWTNSLHTRFLQAINYIGLEKAVPKRILEFMNVPGLTRENVASHLQKYRMFLKKVAERGFWSSQTLSERALRSSFATGYSSMMFKNHHQQYPPQPLRTFQPGYGGNYYGPSCSSYGFPRHPSQEASSVNSAPPQFRYGQTGLFGNSSFQRPLMFGNTNPFYHPNQTRFGMQPNNGSNGFPTATTPMTMYQQPNQAAGSQFQSIGSPLPSYNFQFCSSSSSANMETMNNSFSPFNPNSNYAGIRLNSNGELGTGQVGFSGNELSTGFNVGSGSLNWTNNITTNGNNNLNNAPTTAANGILGCVPPQGGFSSCSSSTGFGNFLAQGESSASSILFENANQFSPPPPFTAGNHECTLVLPPLSHQNTSAVLQNSGGGIDFSFNNITNDAGSDNQQELEDSDLELFFGSNHCTTPPYQQGIEGVLNLGSPYQAELSSTVNELLNVEFSNSCSLADKAPWNEQSSALKFQVAEETVNANFGGSALAGNDYLPNLVQPQRNPGAGKPVNSELNGMHQETATSDENQVWEDDFLDLLLGNEPY